jgi:uncharacterized DUF497 family protein
MHLHVEWSPERSVDNVRQHGVSFSEAATVFGDPRSRTIADTLRGADSSRFVTLGLSQRARMLVVAHVDRGTALWIVDARRAVHSPEAKRARVRFDYDFNAGIRAKYAARYWEAAARGRLTRAR